MTWPLYLFCAFETIWFLVSFGFMGPSSTCHSPLKAADDEETNCNAIETVMICLNAYTIAYWLLPFLISVARINHSRTKQDATAANTNKIIESCNENDEGDDDEDADSASSSKQTSIQGLVTMAMLFTTLQLGASVSLFAINNTSPFTHDVVLRRSSNLQTLFQIFLHLIQLGLLLRASYALPWKIPHDFGMSTTDILSCRGYCLLGALIMIWYLVAGVEQGYRYYMSEYYNGEEQAPAAANEFVTLDLINLWNWHTNTATIQALLWFLYSALASSERYAQTTTMTTTFIMLCTMVACYMHIFFSGNSSSTLSHGDGDSDKSDDSSLVLMMVVLAAQSVYVLIGFLALGFSYLRGEQQQQYPTEPNSQQEEPQYYLLDDSRSECSEIVSILV